MAIDRGTAKGTRADQRLRSDKVAWLITVAADGTAKVTISNADATLGSAATSLFSNGGTALMIHAGPDDMKTDPAGNAGARIACGVIVK